MSEKYVKQQTGTQSQVSNAIEDIFKVLVKFVDSLLEREKATEFILDLKKTMTDPIAISMDETITKRFIRELEEQKIPYLQFEIKGTTQNMIIISELDKDIAKAIQTKTHVQAGLEIDSKYELDRVMAVMCPGELQQRYDGLTRFEADCIIQMGQNLPKPVTIVAEKQGDETYSLFCRAKSGDIVNKLVLETVLNEVNHSQDMQDALKSMSYFQKEKTEFLNAVEDIRKFERGREAYLFSMTDTSKYIHIEEDCFSVYKSGKKIQSLRMSDAQSLYADVVKFIGNSLDNPIYKTAEEVQKLGGIKGVFEEAKSEINNKDPLKTFGLNSSLKKWMAETANIESVYAFNNLKETTLKAEDYLAQHPSSRQNPKMIQQQIDDTIKRFNNISTNKEAVRLEYHEAAYQTMLKRNSSAAEKAKLDKDAKALLYDTALAKTIKSGAFIDDKTVDSSRSDISAKSSQNSKTHTVYKEQKEHENNHDIEISK